MPRKREPKPGCDLVPDCPWQKDMDRIARILGARASGDNIDEVAEIRSLIGREAELRKEVRRLRSELRAARGRLQEMRFAILTSRLVSLSDVGASITLISAALARKEPRHGKAK